MEEEEEAILMVELKGLPNPDVINKCRSVSILGLDTSEPVLQLDNNIFRGSYEDIPGTFMLFSQAAGDEKLAYLNKTSKKLSITKIMVQNITTLTQEKTTTSEPSTQDRTKS